MISAPLGRFVPKYSIIRCPATGLMGKDQSFGGEGVGERRPRSREASPTFICDRVDAALSPRFAGGDREKYEAAVSRGTPV
jgi:hypothetical protein